MERKIKKEDIFNFLKTGREFIGNLALKFYGDTLNQAGEKAFSQAIEIGIENTIAALYDANVEDKVIIHVVCEHWGITVSEVEERLINEKFEAVIRELCKYLRLQGFTESEITDFIKINQVRTKIRHNTDLWKLKNNPEKLLKIIKSND